MQLRGRMGGANTLPAPVKLSCLRQPLPRRFKTDFSPGRGQELSRHDDREELSDPGRKRNAEVSPDGRRLAYEADVSGRYDIYVRPFPDVASGRWQESIDGDDDTRPLWSRDSRELFYLSLTGALMRVGVAPGPTWEAAAPTKLFERRYGRQRAKGAGRTTSRPTASGFS
jgi:hypothetical protein